MGGRPSALPGAEASEDGSSPQRTLRPPPGSQVLIFGDSWAEDNLRTTTGIFAGVEGWPIHLASTWNLPVVGNFAKGQSESSSLRQQLEAAKEKFGEDPPWSRSIVIVHSGGNDFIGAEKDYNPFVRGNFWLAHCMWGFHKKTEQVVANLRDFLEALLRLGCRQFVVSELPFTSAIPVLAVAQVAFVNKRGVLAKTHLTQMLEDFARVHSCPEKGEVLAVMVPEVEILNQLVASAGRGWRKLFLKDHFHPTQDTHRQIAQAVAATVPLEAPDPSARRDEAITPNCRTEADTS